ncbi:MAG: heme ABC exporter ATP-binding protein CcmA [Aestuariivirga sp.]
MFQHSLVLEAKSLACERGGRLIFKDLNFTLGSGEVLELRGPNGSGKSSLLRLLAGLNQPASGSLVLNTDTSIAENAHYIGHSEAVKSALTVSENLHFWQSFLGGSDDASLQAFKLEKLSDDETRLLSQGQRRRLALSRLVAVKRVIWLLDEPTVGLDQNALADLTREMKGHLKSGGMIIAATHGALGIKGSKQLDLAEVP